jgi:myo-inositol 2-dehydrogenase/D-chiro-inositol 1-dehydrogenase
MTNLPIRFGILSAAHYHSFHWGNAATKNPDVTLIGLWDDNVARGTHMARRIEAPFFADLAALLDECDAVGVTSETVNHVALIEAACASGTSVLAEKPMARDLKECAQIGRSVASSGIMYMQNFPKRYDHAHQELVSIVARGELGEISLVRIRHGNDLKLPGHPAADEWYGDPVAAGGGALIDEGIHAADFLYWLMGYPEAVTGFANRPLADGDADTTAVTLFRYASGAIGEIATGHTFSGGEASIEVYGPLGVAILSGADLGSVDLASPPYLKVALRGDTSFRGSDAIPGLRSGVAAYHGKAVDGLVRVLKGEAEPPVSFEDGWRSVAMVQAAYCALRTEKSVHLPLSLQD